MDEQIQQHLSDLKKTRNELLGNLERIEHAIRALEETRSNNGDDVVISPDEYKGMRIWPAVLKYFDKFGHQPTHLDEILQVLQRGGLRLGDSRHKKNLKTTLTMNAKKNRVVWDKEKEIVSMPPVV